MTAPELAVILEQRGLRVRARTGGRGFMAQCPAHADGRHLSLTVSEGCQGRRLLYCFAGCDFERVRRALGLPRDVFAGWSPYYHQRKRGLITGIPALTLDYGERYGFDARIVPPPAPRTGRSRDVRDRVLADLGLLFAEAGDRPVMYSAKFGADRVGAHHTAIARALRYLVAEGAIRRGPDIATDRTGRSTRTYRRAWP